jgi:hypothetical protein
VRFRLPKAVWIVMACVAFAAQVVPQAWGGACDRGCCAAESDGCCCSACPAAPAAPPCHCQLDARQDLPLAVSSRSTPDRDEFEQAPVEESASLEAPPALGVSREYAAASLSVPIRPVRILYGVWRN